MNIINDGGGSGLTIVILQQIPNISARITNQLPGLLQNLNKGGWSFQLGPNILEWNESHTRSIDPKKHRVDSYLEAIGKISRLLNNIPRANWHVSHDRYIVVRSTMVGPGEGSRVQHLE